ncbi:prohibitin-1 [Aureobasidium subglaciale]|nr:prohibitin-1 [Aureobasidium subglaciale]
MSVVSNAARAWMPSTSPKRQGRMDAKRHHVEALCTIKQLRATAHSHPPPPTMAANALGAIYKWAVPAALGLSLANASMYDVKGGTRAVIFDRLSGVKEGVMSEGTHFLIPWLQKSIIYDVRTKPRNISTTTGSKDMQMVSLTLRVLHRPEVKALPKIYQNLGQDYDERVLPSIGNEVLKAIVAQFDAAELITQREAVSNRIRTDLLRRAAEFNIALEDVSITHMTFGKEFTKAVEEKQIAQQEAERARFIVEKAEQERQANVIRAEGEAESADVISKAVAKAGDGLVQIRRIETQKEIAQMMANNPNVTYLPGGGSGTGQNGGQGGNFLLGLRS